MFKRLLVPLDGSELAESALAPALTLAQQVEGEVTLLAVPVLQHVPVALVDSYHQWLPDSSLADTREEMKRYLKAVKKRWQRPDMRLRTCIIEGDVASVIVVTAAAEQIDLILMSTHGRSGFSRWMLGSVTERVLARASCPVLAVRASQPLRRLLVPLDGSAVAEMALSAACAIASLLGSRVTLLMVANYRDSDRPDLDQPELAGAGSRVALRIRSHDQAEAYLRSVAGLHQPEVGSPVQVVLTEGPVAQRILEFAEEQRIDVIVMATHGRTGLRRWLYGSVAEKVMRGAHCGLLLVRAPSHLLT